MSELWGVVLVGGRSSRMGRDKAALPHPAGGTFLEHAIRRLRDLGCPVAVSGWDTLPAACGRPPAVVAIPDPVVAGETAHLGPVTGIVAAAAHAAAAQDSGAQDSAAQDSGAQIPGVGGSAILVTPVDMPALTSDHLRGMLESWREIEDRDTSTDPRAPSQPLIATFDGAHLEPLVAIYPLTLLEPLQRLSTGADRSLNRWLRDQPHRLYPLPPEAAANVNTPAQYQTVLSSPPLQRLPRSGLNR